MNFKKMMKRGQEGFTLVELIVVIAILAILGGVAVPAYSGYVEKANKQADISLASEIKHALILAHYAGTLEPGATVVVYYGESDVKASEDDGADAAMVAAFGESYAESLRLKYNGWSADLGVITNGEMVEYVNNSAFNAESNNVENLLDSIQYITDELSGVLNSGVTIDENSGLGIYLTNAGINLSDSVAASNATTLYVADKIANATDLNDADALASFTTAWQSMDIGHFNTMYESDAFSSNAAHYAQVLALATYVDNQTAGATNYVSLLGSDSGAQGKEILTNVNTVLESIAKNNATEAGAYMTSDQSKSDAMAFLTYMNGITSSADSLFEDTDLNSEHYYNDGTLLNYVTDYMDAANALQNSGITAQDGAFVFIYNPNSKNIVNCVPEDY